MHNRMFEVSFQLSEFLTKFKMVVLNPKFVNVVEIFLQHMSSLCIDCSKMNELGALDKCVGIIAFRQQILELFT